MVVNCPKRGYRSFAAVQSVDERPVSPLGKTRANCELPYHPLRPVHPREDTCLSFGVAVVSSRIQRHRPVSQKRARLTTFVPHPYHSLSARIPLPTQSFVQICRRSDRFVPLRPSQSLAHPRHRSILQLFDCSSDFLPAVLWEDINPLVDFGKQR